MRRRCASVMRRCGMPSPSRRTSRCLARRPTASPCRITVSHHRRLVHVADAEERKVLAERVVAEGLTVDARPRSQPLLDKATIARTATIGFPRCGACRWVRDVGYGIPTEATREDWALAGRTKVLASVPWRDERTRRSAAQVRAARLQLVLKVRNFGPWFFSGSLYVMQR
jgi:hypothetical protein